MLSKQNGNFKGAWNYEIENLDHSSEVKKLIGESLHFSFSVRWFNIKSISKVMQPDFISQNPYQARKNINYISIKEKESIKRDSYTNKTQQLEVMGKSSSICRGQ